MKFHCGFILNFMLFIIEKDLGSSCGENSQCNDSNAICSNTTCTCPANFYDDNGGTQGGNCQLS